MMVAAAGLLAAFFGRGWHRLGALPRYPRAIRPALGFGAFIALLGVPIVLGTVVIIVLRLDAAQFESMSAPDKLQLEALLRTMTLVGVLAVVTAVVWVERTFPVDANWQMPPLETPRPRAAATRLGVLSWLGSWPIVMTTSAAAVLAVYLVTGRSPDPIAHETLRLFEQARGSIWLPINIAVVVLVAPIAEEVQYRFFLQRAFRSLRVKPWMAITLTSLLFAAMHWAVAAPHALVPLFVLSLALGWSYEKSGRLLTPFLLHAGFNLTNVAIFLLAWEREAAPVAG